MQNKLQVGEVVRVEGFDQGGGISGKVSAVDEAGGFVEVEDGTGTGWRVWARGTGGKWLMQGSEVVYGSEAKAREWRRTHNQWLRS